MATRGTDAQAPHAARPDVGAAHRVAVAAAPEPPRPDTERAHAVADGSPDQALRTAVAEALALPPGPELLATLITLAGEELSARERTETLKAWRAMTSLCEAGRLDAVAALDRAVPHPVDRAESLRPAAEELSAALALAPSAASRTVGLARRLDRELHAVADALVDGRMDLSQARLVAAITRDVTDAAACAALQEVAVRHAPATTVPRLRRMLEAEAERLLPGWAARRAARGRTERDVTLTPSPIPGCRRITADLPSLDAAAVWLEINRLAAAALAGGVDGDGRPETRTVAQLRADVLTAVLTGAGGWGLDGSASGASAGVVAPGAPPRPGTRASGDATSPAPGVRPVTLPPRERFSALAEVQVVVAADTLLGQSDLPAHVPGIGPIDADEARSIAADARWRRLLVDPVSGTLLDRGTTVYRPPGRLRQHVLALDGTCVFPTCCEPAVLAQVDHTVNFGETGLGGRIGTTSADNTGPLCPRHHDAKTHLGWQLHQPAAGRFTWTSPSGSVHDCAPAPVLPGWQSRRPGWSRAAGGTTVEPRALHEHDAA